MERVDVAIVGGGVAGLAAAWAAAAGGVRALVVERSALPRSTPLLKALTERDLRTIGLESGIAKVHNQLIVEGLHGRSEPAQLGGSALIHAVRGQALHQHLWSRARSAGAEIRDEINATSSELDHDGWLIRVAGGEPIRAPILIVADGARSRTLESIGIASAQRFSTRHAEVVSFLCGTWALPPSEMSRHAVHRLRESAGPLGRLELLPGKDQLTVAIGPIWRGVGADSRWPATEGPTVDAALEVACRTIGLPPVPVGLEVIEWRLDALPTPPVFDGGIVIGAAAGHRIHRPLSADGATFKAGHLAGRAAARAVLARDWTATALAESLGSQYRELVMQVEAEVAHEAHGLRRARVMSNGPWSSAFAARDSQI